MSLPSVVGGFKFVSRCKHHRVYGFREGVGKRVPDLPSPWKKSFRIIPVTTFPHPLPANTFTGIILNPTSHRQINIRIFWHICFRRPDVPRVRFDITVGRSRENFGRVVYGYTSCVALWWTWGGGVDVEAVNDAEITTWMRFASQ